MVKVKVRKRVTLKSLQAMSKTKDTILVGFDRGQKGGKHNDIDVADLAKLQSYGDATIPARPFLEDGIANYISDIERRLKDSFKKKVKTGKDDHEKVGKFAEEKVIAWVESRPYKPNAPSTLAKKEGNLPLEDSAFMLACITSHVVRKGDYKPTESKPRKSAEERKEIALEKREGVLERKSQRLSNAITRKETRLKRREANLERGKASLERKIARANKKNKAKQ